MAPPESGPQFGPQFGPGSGPESGLTLIACGALARELLAITAQFPDGQVDLICLPASWHNHPEKIVPGLRRKVAALRRKGRLVAVVYGDCGTGGEIDTFLESENVPRIPGPHCYEMYLQQPDFDDEMERELGTFFLTDYMVRHFERIIMQGMGLRRHPQLRDLYFGNYTRVLYIAQTEDPVLERKAMVAAHELGLAYQYRFAGFGRFTPWVTDMVATNMQGD
jgi:SAM-dependent methyltransferase